MNSLARRLSNLSTSDEAIFVIESLSLSFDACLGN